MLRSTIETNRTPTIPESNFYNPFHDLLKLTPGKRYTFLIESTFGQSTVSVHMILHSVRTCRFDKHENCVEIFFKPRGKQKICQILFYGSKAYAVWEGWLELEERINGGVLDSLGFRRNLDHAALAKPNSISQVVQNVPLSPVCLRIKVGPSAYSSSRSQPQSHQSH